MKNSVLLIAFIMTFTCLFSQNRQDYYVSIKPEFALGTIQKTTNPDETLTFSMNNTGFATFLNEKPVYYFEKAFPTAVLEKNKRVYRVTLDDNTHLGDFFNRDEVEFVELIEELDIELYIPNDYDYIDRDGPNTALELIKATLAWNITTGNTNLLAGVYDRHFNIQHEDTENKIAQIFTGANLNPDQFGNYHGTMVSTALAGETDNNKGVASIGYNTNLIITSGGGANKILQLSQQSGVRVINISMKWSCVHSQATENILEEVWNGNELYPPVVIIAAAGNGKAAQAAGNSGFCGEDGNGYVYPAAYNHVIAVSALGHLVPRGTDDIFYNYGVSWEDVARSDINNPNSTTTNNDKVDLSAPGRHVLTANLGTDGYSRHSGTSLASPIVAGAAALMLDINPNLTSNQVRNILKNTTDEIYHIPENIEYTDLYGTGRLNVYRAVLTAQCMANPTPGLDLMVRNSVDDYGEEPDDNSEILWKSTDIWVRNQNDGREVRQHQNPEYNPSSPNYAYVRITNKSCEPSLGTEELYLHWAKAGTGNGWPDLWNGNITNPVLMGDLLSTQTIPVLEPGQEAILEFEWYPPNPEDYHGTSQNNDPWHFCLLARIVAPNDPMTSPEGVGNMVYRNNNIAMRNVTVVSNPQPGSLQPGGNIFIGNISGNESETFNFQFTAFEESNDIYKEAEVVITLDETSWGIWNEGGSQMDEGIRVYRESERQLIVTNNNAKLKNMTFQAGEWGMAYVSFNFLTKEVTNTQKFELHVVQQEALTGDPVGSETFEIYRNTTRPHFEAQGNSSEQGNDIQFSATTIGEPAVYNWYAPDGTLIHTGEYFTISPEFAGDYKLEVIAETDGHKDYTEIYIDTAPNADHIVNISPNPASTNMVVNYQIDQANSAYLKVVDFYGLISDNYIVDLQEDSIGIDLSSYPSGNYAVVLIVDGQPVHAKQLLIN